MAFGFNTPAASAPSGGGFSFAAPASGTTGAAPAPAFGAAPATNNLFGASGTTTPTTPTAAAPTTTFGTPAAAAPAPSLFRAPAPAAPATSLFGAPAPAPTSAFGTPAPTGGGVFGATVASPAPANFFGSTTPAATAVPGATPAAPLSGKTPFAMLPPEMQRAVNSIHEQMMNHRRAIMQVETMAPALLRDDSSGQILTSSPADTAAGVASTSSIPLPKQVFEIQTQVDEIQKQFEKCRGEALVLRKMYETSVAQAVMFGKWPIEALAVRRGVKLTTAESKADSKVQNDLRTLLEQRAASVDRVERMPSPYMWEILQDFETRLLQLQSSIQAFHSHLMQSRKANQEENVTGDWVRIVVQQQSEALHRVAGNVGKLHEQMNRLRLRYREYEKFENVLDKADLQENERERHIEEEMRAQFVQAGPPPSTKNPSSATSTPAPGLFGATASTPAPGLFGSTPAPATGTTSLFGSAPAPATGATSLFGGTPAPAAGAFGTTPAPGAFGAAPAPGGSLFGSTTTPLPAFGATSTSSRSKSKSKNKSRR